MPLYEHVFLARQDLAQGQVDTLSEGFTKIIEDGGGRVAKTEYWGLRSIAYRIQKNRKAHYVLLAIEAPAPAIHELERQVGLSEDVLRHMTVRVDVLETEPSAMMRRDREREAKRDERGGGDRDRDRGGFGGGGRDRDRGGGGERPRFDRGPREGGFERAPMAEAI